ncbi:MAG: ribosome silencing factor [Firmicutes bacterium]|nr:ribosome silencing factor [Bacillota bacterium]MDY5585738.1 ribosome silencing factor [Eubacteriales bacterium]
MENEIVKGIASLLESKKLKNVEAFDLKFKSELVKYIILATSPNEKYSRQVAVELQKEFEEKGIDAKIEGEFPGEWVILDLGEILIEIFTEESRKYYNLEKLWGNSKNRAYEPVKKRRKKSEK